MGKNTYIKHVKDELDDVNPSCMWGIIHAVDYHHWRHNVKRLLPHRKDQGRHAKGHGTAEARAVDRASGEMQMLLHEEERTLPVNQSTKESATIRKKSMRARIKALIADQTHKEGKGKHCGSRFSSRSGLKRTYSIHHLEPPDHSFGEKSPDWERPIIFFPGNEEDKDGTKHHNPTKMNVTEKPDAGGENFNKLRNKDASKDNLKEQTDVLEIFKVKKELFLEILKHADDGIRKLSHIVPASKAKSRLTKSGSFPFGDLSHRRNFGPIKLKHKQSEIWTTPQGEKFPTSNLVPMDVFKYSKNLLSRSGPSADNCTGTMLGRALSLILESTVDSDKEGHTDFVMPLKDTKQAVKFGGLEGKNEANSSLSALGEVSNRQDSSTIEKDFAESSAKSIINRDGGKSSCRSHDIDYRSNTLSYRRSSSLQESLGKYASLFEGNFRKEVKLQSSKSLRLSNENETRSGKSDPILFTRIRSLSHLDELYSSLQNVVQGDANLADWPITSAEESSLHTKDDMHGKLNPTGFFTSSEEHAAPDDTQELGDQNEMLERSHCIQPVDTPVSGENITGESSARMEDLHEHLTVYKSNFHRDQETNNLVITDSGYPEPSPSSASGNFFEDEASTLMEFQSAGGLEIRSDHFDVDSSINWQNINDRASSSLLSSKMNSETVAVPDDMKELEKNKPVKKVDSDLDYPVKKVDSDLDYVRDLLERSGFTKNAIEWTWHSLEQPLNPSIFEEMEGYWHQELECSKEELWSCYHHQLLFELVNEELARLYDRSSTYYPKALSSSCHIRPFPVGNNLLEEICSSIDSWMSLKPEQMQSLDSVIDLDLKNDGWMNLQLESECMVLELEDMIFDELLEELGCL